MRVDHAWDALMETRTSKRTTTTTTTRSKLYSHVGLHAIMPHSVSPGSRSHENGGDEVLPDAPAGQEEREGTGVKLEDMFNDDGDEEFPASSAPGHTKMEESSPPAMPG